MYIYRIKIIVCKSESYWSLQLLPYIYNQVGINSQILLTRVQRNECMDRIIIMHGLDLDELLNASIDPFIGLLVLIKCYCSLTRLRQILILAVGCRFCSSSLNKLQLGDKFEVVTTDSFGQWIVLPVQQSQIRKDQDFASCRIQVEMQNL